MPFVQNFFSRTKIQKFFFPRIFHPKNQPLSIHQDIYNKTQILMDIQQYIFNNTGVLLPISGGNGLSQDQAIVIGSEAKYLLISVENEFIRTMLSDGYWNKVEQSLMITINHFMGDGGVVERVCTH
jgi:hypothetical protein